MLVAIVTSRFSSDDRRLQGLHHPLGDLDRLHLLLGPVDQDRELVAAEAGGGVHRAHAVLQAAAHLLQDLVAGVVAERVVDVLEVVHVHEQDGHRHVLAALGGERVTDAVAEQGAVGQAGEDVVEGLVLELGLEGLALADVAHVQHDPRDRLVGEQVGGQHFHVAASDPRRGAPGTPSRPAGPGAAAATEATNATMREASSSWTSSPRDCSARSVGLVPEGRLDRGADVVDGRVLADHADHVGGVLDQRAQPRLRALVGALLGDGDALQRERDLAGERAEALLGGVVELVLGDHGERALQALRARTSARGRPPCRRARR